MLPIIHGIRIEDPYASPRPTLQQVINCMKDTYKPKSMITEFLFPEEDLDFTTCDNEPTELSEHEIDCIIYDINDKVTKPTKRLIQWNIDLINKYIKYVSMDWLLLCFMDHDTFSDPAAFEEIGFVYYVYDTGPVELYTTRKDIITSLRSTFPGEHINFPGLLNGFKPNFVLDLLNSSETL